MGTTNLGIPFLATNQASPEVTVNAALVALDKAMNSPKSVPLSDADHTISVDDFIANVFFSFSGTDTAGRTIILPQLNVDSNPLRKIFIAENLTTSSPPSDFALSFSTASSPPGTNVSLKASDGPMLLFSDGTNVILIGKLAGTSSGTFAAGDDSRITGAQTVANLNVTYPSLVSAPAHFNSSGTTGSFAFGNDTASPPVPAFFVCVSTNNWLRINTAGAFSNAF